MGKKKKVDKVAHEKAIKSLTRYQVRNSLFRMRDGRVENQSLANFVWSLIQPQLKHPEGLKTFSFDWDVDPSQPHTVLRRDEWDTIKAEKYPDEYKKQEQVEEEITLFTAQA